jgi:hypothetical protein
MSIGRWLMPQVVRLVVVFVLLSGCSGLSVSVVDATTDATDVFSMSASSTTREPTTTTAVSITATTSPTTTATTSSTATTVLESPLSEITLGFSGPGDVGFPDWQHNVVEGLGVVLFGDLVDDVMATMTRLLGEPQGDTVSEAPFGEEGDLGSGPEACRSALGTVCFEYLRVVEWESFGLTIVFSDSEVSFPASDHDDRELQPAEPNLRGYRYSDRNAELPLFTEHGITVGSTVGELVDAYGDRLGFSEDPCIYEASEFYVAVDGEGLIGLRGELSAAPNSPDAVVRSIVAGLFQSNC